jgi:hypothetical protein
MEPTAPRLRIEPWPDPVIDHLGFAPTSPYLETVWLGVLGPTVCWAWRRFASHLELEPDGFDIDLVETARLLGLGAGVGRGSPLWRSLERAVRFEVGQWRHGRSALAVRLRVPPLPRRYLVRLPASAEQAHQAWMRHLPAATSA